ncbi:alkaline phosphatase family protein [Arvimicrobium flavum]|uniref:alkaline phosphatase family protein n=1 Tax=Arvimicrobium flavum TaxID=3393320 RepID=UPI00237A559C|nr:alkaline phosphatase family protein [Mesorhizobium shangrilense]
MAEKRRKPNVLLITCDQWRGECLSSAGHPVVQTPNADLLAKGGVSFRRHYAGAAPCSPARACLYTGLYQMNNRVCSNGTPLDGRHLNIALAARALGYDPTLFGYTDVSPDPRRHHPNDPLLRSYEGILPGFSVRRQLFEHHRPWLSWLLARGVDSSAGYPDIHRPVGGASEPVTSAPPIYSSEETPAAFLTDEFIRWHGEQSDAGAWFAHISFISPHPPFIVPPPFNTMYDPADGPAFRRAGSVKAEARQHPFVEYMIDRQRRDSFIPGAEGRVAKWDEATFRQIRAIYYGMVSEVDAQIGRIWQAIKAAGEWEDTVIVLTSDHAELMGDHFMLGKGGYFEGSYHIPLIVHAPNVTAAGSTVTAFTEAVDVMPTLVDLLGGEPPAWVDGRSLKPFLKGKKAKKWRDAAHWEFDFRSVERQKPEAHFGLPTQRCNLAVIRGERYKYVHFGGLPPALYDLADDPDETRNLADDAGYLGVRLEMAEQLLAWRAEHLDQSLALSELTEKGVAGKYAPRL